jgi:hypothetical protein
LNVEAETRILVGVLSQESLIGVAVVQTGRERVSTLAVEPMRQDFDDFGSRRSRARGGSTNENHDGEKFEPAHELSLAAVGMRFNLGLRVKYLFFSGEDETMRLSCA